MSRLRGSATAGHSLAEARRSPKGEGGRPEDGLEHVKHRF